MKLSRILSILMVLALPVDGFAQAGAAAGQAATQGHEPGESITTRDTLSQADLKALSEKMEQWNRIEANGGVPPRIAKLRTTAMLRVLNVACTVTDATYRGTAPGDAQQNVYEAACKDGMGYLLFLKQSNLSGISCLVAGGDTAPVKCVLAANADSKVLAGAELARNHIQCNVQKLNWLRASDSNSDDVEVVCEGEAGYVVRAPQPGSGDKLEVLSCQDAIKQGVTCELTRNLPTTAASMADARPTLTWFKDALSRNGLGCQTKRARIVGRESIKRRYLVEFECSDRPEGLVAFVPPAGDTVNAFESMDCASAATRGIRCEFVAAQK
jgi:hypothetical protein